MFISYFKTAFRSLLKNKFFSIINILGLAIGMAASLLIFLHVQKELSYDKFHELSDRIYRVRLDRFSQGQLAEQMATTCNASGPGFRDNIPEVTDMVRISNHLLEGIIDLGDKKFRLEKPWFASSSFFKIFSYPLINGDPETCLIEPNHVVISESMAKKFFGEENPMGKIIKMNSRTNLQISGVFKDFPENTHFKADMLISFQTMIDAYGDWVDKEWWIDVCLTYLLLKPDADPVKVNEKIQAFAEDLQKEEMIKRGKSFKFHLQQLKDIHLHSNYPAEAEVNGNYRSVYFLLVISALIMIIAWVNFINMATAKSLERAREIGLRKVAGASRLQLISQFLAESLIINSFAVIISILLVIQVYPVFNQLTGMDVNLDLFRLSMFWFIFILIIISGAIISGLYPAFILSSFTPSNAFKQENKSNTKGFSMRKALIVFQFIISIFLITGTLAVYKQLSYMKSRDVGLDMENTIVLKGPVVVDTSWLTRHLSFKNELLNEAGIDKVCVSHFVPGDKIWFTLPFCKTANFEQGKSRTLCANFIDDKFIPYYGIEVLAGRNFDRDIKSDRLSFILSRKASELLGYNSPEEALNEDLTNEIWKYNKKVIGITEDFHQESLKENLTPLVFIHFEHFRYLKNFSIHINSPDIALTIEAIEKKWNTFFPGNTFEYYFLEEHYNSQYKDDAQFGKTFSMFSVLAIIVAGLGLFALSLYFVLQRSREIAVRKVFGAGSLTIMGLLSSEYIKLLAFAAVIAFPLSYLIMERWLENYANRIQFTSLFIFIPLLLMLFIVFISIFYQINKAARANPAETLKYE